MYTSLMNYSPHRVYLHLIPPAPDYCGGGPIPENIITNYPKENIDEFNDGRING